MHLFKLNVVKSVFQISSASRSLACQINPFREISYSCVTAFFNQGNSKQTGGGIRQSLCGGLSQISSVRQYHKLRVNDVPENATEESVRQHFSQFGMLLSVFVVRNIITKKSEGSAYVVFADRKALDSAMNYQPHVICNKPVSICPFSQISFVLHGLSPLTKKKSLHDYFSHYGKVLYCQLMHDRTKETGFVHFSANDEIDKELASHIHVIDGKKVEVSFCPPKELTLFVGNLSPSTTDQVLHAFYSQFGNLLRAEVKLDRLTGKSRGFGYVSFSSQQELDNAIHSIPHLIDGREVVVNYRTNEFTIFVAELPPNTSEDHLRKYFEQFGPVYSCIIARNKQTDQLLRHGWLMFSSQQGLKNALAARPHVIDGKLIGVQEGNKQAGDVSTLFVGGLSPKTTSQKLYDLFSKFGTVVKSEVKLDRVTGQSRRFAYVAYSSLCEVSKALLGGPYKVDGRVIKVMHYDSLKIAKNSASSDYGS